MSPAHVLWALKMTTTTHTIPTTASVGPISRRYLAILFFHLLVDVVVAPLNAHRLRGLLFIYLDSFKSHVVGALPPAAVTARWSENMVVVRKGFPRYMLYSNRILLRAKACVHVSALKVEKF